MKPAGTRVTWLVVNVAPRRGAWIETPLKLSVGVVAMSVAPRRGAWIETPKAMRPAAPMRSSHPAGVRGLKHKPVLQEAQVRVVAPRRGAWIETAGAVGLITRAFCRTPQGCVD